MTVSFTGQSPEGVSLISASHGCLAYRLVWVEPPDTTPLRRKGGSENALKQARRFGRSS